MERYVLYPCDNVIIDACLQRKHNVGFGSYCDINFFEVDSSGAGFFDCHQELMFVLPSCDYKLLIDELNPGKIVYNFMLN